MPRVILHITTASAWEQARPRGVYAADTLAGQGFIHCSTGRQWLRPLRALFAGVPDLVLLQVDESRLRGAVLRYEEAEPGGDRFPHVHGPIPVDAVVAVEPVPTEVVTAWAPLPERLADLVRGAHGAEPSGVHEWRHRGYTVTTRPERIDVAAVHAWLCDESYWAAGRSRATMDRVVAASNCFGLLDHAGTTVGFARVVSDGAVIAYLADVVVLPAHRGLGLGAFLVQSALEHPDLQAVRRWVLATRDAHGLYTRLGFVRGLDPERWMTRPPT